MITRRFAAVFVISLLYLGSAAQDAQINRYDSEGKKSGPWESYYENGKIRTRGTFREGHPVGEMLKYYPGGILQASMYFDETGTTSRVKLFYENGQLAAEGKYIDKLKDSTWNYYSAYDKRKAVVENMSMGKKNGPSYKYYNGGKTSEYIEWKDDKKHGKWEQYYENGQLRLTCNYSSDLLEGIFLSYNPDGSFSIKGRYLGGTMDGTWIYYDDKGEQELIVEYVEGRMLPNEEMDKRVEEFSKKIKDAIGNLDDTEIPDMMQ